MLELAGLYLIAINAVTFGAFALDKRAAGRRARRVPERRLLTLAALGGSPGALIGQQVLRHKTRKEPFRTWLWTIVGVQALGLGLAALAYLLPR